MVNAWLISEIFRNRQRLAIGKWENPQLTVVRPVYLFLELKMFGLSLNLHPLTKPGRVAGTAACGPPVA